METREIKIKRLAMRSMRRGIKEMDLILTDFATRSLGALPDNQLALYDQLLSENDHDLYAWISGAGQAPDHYVDMVKAISDGASGLTKPN